jgi:hypothetical protein
VCRARALQASDEPGHRWTRRKEADGEEAVPLVLRDDVGEMPERHAQPLPSTVLAVLLGREHGGIRAYGGPEARKDLLDAARCHAARTR